MNVDHLQLFYYVARHGGVRPAMRYLPSSMKQAWVMAQLRLLEGFLGKKLFQRRPFGLTLAGLKLYDFVQPFFDGIEPLLAKMRAEARAGSISQGKVA